MQEYKTTNIVRINGGIIGLNKKLADARQGLVRPIKGSRGAYEVLSPIEFKAGETIRIENPDKTALMRLEKIGSGKKYDEQVEQPKIKTGE